MTIHPQRHRCPFEALDYSQVGEGKIVCTVCGRFWTLTEKKIKTDDDAQPASIWQWVATPPFAEQSGEEADRKRRQFWAAQNKRKGKSTTPARTANLSKTRWPSEPV